MIYYLCPILVYRIFQLGISSSRFYATYLGSISLIKKLKSFYSASTHHLLLSIPSIPIEEINSVGLILTCWIFSVTSFLCLSFCYRRIFLLFLPNLLHTFNEHIYKLPPHLWFKFYRFLFWHTLNDQRENAGLLIN